ncbi:hypothetical protein [Microtetraspora niveoalba]|uniref:hypothetical protein n=1 Tax=Microtetraspora niveoalba TaxID=46175 RepID=UPI00083251F4|nr:hypothetical protein [Microtetraspora niveoalba]
MTTQQRPDDVFALPPAWRPDPVPLPDWAQLRERVAARGGQDGQAPSLDAITLKTQGYEPGYLLQLDEERELTIMAVRDGLERVEKAAGDAKAALDTRSRIGEPRYERVREAYEEAVKQVELLEAGPSREPGDGLPSSIALSGWRKTVGHWAVPLLILLVLLAVETPIYYETFLNWGDSMALTYLLAVGAVFVFVFGPHFYGRNLREWQEYRTRGEEAHGLAKWPPLLIIVPVIWLFAIGSVAYFRMNALFHTISVEDQETGESRQIASVASDIGVVPTLVLVLALLIFTALIATELGRRMGNPNDKELREQRARLRRAEAEMRAADHWRTEIDTRLGEIAGLLDELERRKRTCPAQIERGFDSVETVYVQELIRPIGDEELALFVPVILDRHRRRHEWIVADS